MPPRTNNEATRHRLNVRLDALLYILRLNRGRVSLGNLRAIARRRGLRCGRMGIRRMLVAIYEDMKKDAPAK